MTSNIYNEIMCKENLILAGFTKFPDDIVRVAPLFTTAEQWLNDCKVADALAYYGLNTDAEFMQTFQKVWQSVLENHRLQCAIYTIATYLFDDNIAPAWDKFERNTVDMLPAVIIMSGWQKHISNMRAKGFDAHQIEFNRREMRTTVTKAMRVYNKPGMLMSEMIWASILVRANLVEFGRMQYETKTAGETYICNAIARDDKIIGIHIPRGGPLSPDVVTQSIATARDHFGKLPFVCNSWLLGAELESHLEPGGNIAKFRKHFRIIRNLESESIYHFLFNTPDGNPDITKLPADTSLRRSVKDAMQSGTHFRDAIGVLKD